MSYNNNFSNPVTRVRVSVGDHFPDFEYLTDETYAYLLGSKTEAEATRQAAIWILAQLTSGARERTGQIEVYGADRFKNYLDFLKEMINNPSISPVVPVPYAGGISKSDMYLNRIDPDANVVVPPIENDCGACNAYSDDPWNCR